MLIIYNGEDLELQYLISGGREIVRSLDKEVWHIKDITEDKTLGHILLFWDIANYSNTTGWGE